MEDHDAWRAIVYMLSPETAAEHYMNEPGRAPFHQQSDCDPGPCLYHSPSDHKMKDWPKYLRASALVERLCPHSVGHPDPDSVKWLREVTGQGSWSLHGCDGCCFES